MYTKFEFQIFFHQKKNHLCRNDCHSDRSGSFIIHNFNKRLGIFKYMSCQIYVAGPGCVMQNCVANFILPINLFIGQLERRLKGFKGFKGGIIFLQGNRNRCKWFRSMSLSRTEKKKIVWINLGCFYILTENLSRVS